MSRADDPIATASQTVGPFFHFALAANPALGLIATTGADGERMRLRVRVLDGDGEPVPDALIEIYQADASGNYARSAATAGPGTFTGFGRLPTDASGACVFETIKPGPVRVGGETQAPHVNVCVLARGLLRQVYTRIYFAGDAGHDADPVLRLVPSDRVDTLMARRIPDGRTLASTGEPAEPREPGEPPTWDFTVRLQGDGETVFFDL